MEYLYIGISALIVVGFILCYITTKKLLEQKQTEKIMLNFADYNGVLTFIMDKAYEMIYNDKILIYSLEATKLSDKEFNFCTKSFATLVQKFLGPRLLKEFIFLYGDMDTFLFNVVHYFNTKYEADEIRRTSVSNMMEEEIKTED